MSLKQEKDLRRTGQVGRHEVHVFDRKGKVPAGITAIEAHNGTPSYVPVPANPLLETLSVGRGEQVRLPGEVFAGDGFESIDLDYSLSPVPSHFA
jgi:hypothetical protein